MLLQQLHCLVSKALDELSTEGDTAAFEMFPKAMLPWFGWRQEHQHQESPLRCRASGIHLTVQWDFHTAPLANPPASQTSRLSAHHRSPFPSQGHRGLYKGTCTASRAPRKGLKGSLQGLRKDWLRKDGLYKPLVAHCSEPFIALFPAHSSFSVQTCCYHVYNQAWSKGCMLSFITEYFIPNLIPYVNHRTLKAGYDVCLK